MSEERVHIFGVRHHGPGSARRLERALESLRPDCVLIEGPPDADNLLPLAAHREMKPPVAVLIYVPDRPQRSAFYPFASFSPEWRAIQYGLKHDAVLRFIDLPQWHQLAEEKCDEAAEPGTPGTGDGSEEDEPVAAAPAAGKDGEQVPATAPATAALAPSYRRDPLGLLAEAAGFSDGERWWDHLVESRRHDHGQVFGAIREAMTALRDELGDDQDLRERRREAYMRKSLRTALKDGFQRIAVVCGAWHAPALDPARLPSVAHDQALLTGLSKTKTEAAWSPWTYDRLAYGSGYGAGVVSPAWYELLWSDERHVVTVWMTRVARLMREKDLDASSAHVIEAVRLSESLAALRGRPLPGLEELDEAALSVVCGGQEAPMTLIRRKLVVGERLGAIPADSPMPPLQRDLAAQQKRLRLPAAAAVKQYDLDLRKPMDLERSQLIHRLNLLEVPWGEPGRAAHGGLGTFHERWQVQWEPEYAVKLIEAARFGNTVESAAAARTLHVAESAERLLELTSLLDHALLAALPEAVQGLVAAIQNRASTGSDVPQLMAALPPLARAARYGNVRRTDATLVAGVVGGVVERIGVGLPSACTSLNDDAAGELFQRFIDVQAALATLANEDHLDEWFAALTSVAEQDGAHALLRGRALRILHDAHRLTGEQLSLAIGLELSPAVARTVAAAWIEGFLSGSGLVLLHDAALWTAVNDWVASLDDEAFLEVLPLVRRTFATFHTAERRQIGERLKRGLSATTIETSPAVFADFDFAAAARVLPVIAQLLGRRLP